MGVGRQEREKGGKKGWKMLRYEGLDKRPFLTWEKKQSLWVLPSFSSFFTYAKNTNNILPHIFYMSLVDLYHLFCVALLCLEGAIPADALAPKLKSLVQKRSPSDELLRHDHQGWQVFRCFRIVIKKAPSIEHSTPLLQLLKARF